MKTRIAALQMNSIADVAVNLGVARRLLEQAAGEGAQLATLPENFAFMGVRDRDKLAHAEADGAGPIQLFLSETARDLGLWLLAGTVPIAVPQDPARVSAACLVFDSQGRRAARYDKIHLFDVDVHREDRVERYRESASIAPGAPGTAVVETPAGRLGLSVCYDLRFPELYRALVAQGAELLSVPAAFTARTGEAHWEVLLRARAVENQCYVIAPGQCGSHPGGRSTWGHSMIVGPWGEVLAERPEDAGVVLAEIDLDRLSEIRAGFPALMHRRM